MTLRLFLALLETNMLDVIFHNISEKYPTRQYCVAMEILDNGVYRVHSTIPALSGLEPDVAALNATNNLSAFIKTVRARFMQLEPK